jgi:hypothetical protein
LKEAMNARLTVKDVTTNKDYCHGRLGEVIRHGLRFSAWKDWNLQDI